MSKSANVAKQRPLCRYFASNICFKGDDCEFSHDRNAKPDLVCRYYSMGSCSYGNKCRYDHVRSSPQLHNAAVASSSGPARTSSINAIFRQPSPTVGAKPSLKQPNSSKLSPNSKPFVPAPIPAINPWSKNSQVASPSALNNFHKSFGLDLELIAHPEMGAVGCSSNTAPHSSLNNIGPESVPLCPYFEVGVCADGEFCRFVHGRQCEMCALNALHPYNESQRKIHHRECLAQHERDMEAAFAEAKSADKQCGICMEFIVEKDLRFAILQNCTHCFCLDCIRKWRKQHNNEQQEVKANTVRACPECRVHSDYVIPSKSWIDDKGEKERLIKVFHENTKKIQCKYVTGGNVDKCPFGNKCFYKHQMPDGTVAEGKSPRMLRKDRRHPYFDLFEFMIIHLSDEDDDDDGSLFGGYDYYFSEELDEL